MARFIIMAIVIAIFWRPILGILVSFVGFSGMCIYGILKMIFGGKR
jgi:hypothetical protein